MVNHDNADNDNGDVDNGGDDKHVSYLPTPRVQNLETDRNLCIVRISFSTMSEYSLKITRRPSKRSRCLENNEIKEKKN